MRQRKDEMRWRHAGRSIIQGLAKLLLVQTLSSIRDLQLKAGGVVSPPAIVNEVPTVKLLSDCDSSGHCFEPCMVDFCLKIFEIPVILYKKIKRLMLDSFFGGVRCHL